MKDARSVMIRDYEPKDFEGMLTMFAGLSKETLRFGLPPYDRARFERWVSGLGGGVLLLAFDSSKVVGVSCIFGRGYSRLRGLGGFFIYLLQGYHNQGLGTFLTKTTLGEAKRIGFHRVGLEVVADNAIAVRAYEKAGFTVEGRMRDAFFGDEEAYHDQLIMGIVL